MDVLLTSSALRKHLNSGINVHRYLSLENTWSNTLRSEQNVRHFQYDSFNHMFFNGNVCVPGLATDCPCGVWGHRLTTAYTMGFHC